MFIGCCWVFPERPPAVGAPERRRSSAVSGEALHDPVEDGGSDPFQDVEDRREPTIGGTPRSVDWNDLLRPIAGDSVRWEGETEQMGQSSNDAGKIER